MKLHSGIQVSDFPPYASITYIIMDSSISNKIFEVHLLPLYGGTDLCQSDKTFKQLALIPPSDSISWTTMPNLTDLPSKVHSLLY